MPPSGGRPVVAVHAPWANEGEWAAALAAAAPDLEVARWADGPDPSRVVACAVWDPPAALLAGAPRLRVIQSLGAGVDHLWRLGAALPDLPILRLVDPAMTGRMAHYALLGVLLFQRRLDLYLAAQRERRWARAPHRDPGGTAVGVLGLGVMGRAVAELLAGLGFRTLGWSRTPKDLPGIDARTGPAGLLHVAGAADILVNVLPLTPETAGLLDRRLFAAARPGVALVHAGRGPQLVEADLLAALDAGHVRGAMLDVFAAEPLPEASPLWAHPRVIVTPHAAAMSNPATAAPAMAAGIRAVLAGGRPAHLADRRRGY